MKVLLINPPSDSPQPIMPLGLAYLAAALENYNISVQVIDAWAEKLNFKSLGERISGLGQIDLIGITVMSPTYTDGIKTIQTAQKASPYSKIIIGGTHPSSLPEDCLKDNPEVDFAAVGEGDNLIVQLVKVLSGKGGQLSEIKGLVYRQGGKIINQLRAEPVEDLDSLPLPARHLFPMSKYQTHPPYRLYNSYATMITSRGCPYRCTYCTKSISGQNFRYQQADRVVKEIKILINEYHIKQIHFYDDDFTIHKKRVEAICDKIIEEKIKIVWSCVTRVDLVDARLLAKMRRSGCWLISYGVESGNQQVLDNARKGYTLKHITEAFRLTKRAGIRTLGYFMAGLPGETKQTLNDTVELSLSLDPDFVSWSITALYPGSEIYQQAVTGRLGNNYIQVKGRRPPPVRTPLRGVRAGTATDTTGKPVVFSAVKTPMPEDSSNVSSLSPFGQGHVFIYQGDIPRDYILKTVNQAYRRFYFRIGYIIRFILKLQTWTEFLSYARTFLQFLNWTKTNGRF